MSDLRWSVGRRAWMTAGTWLLPRSDTDQRRCFSVYPSYHWRTKGWLHSLPL